MDVGDWLRDLGLGQYAASFRDNAIDAGVLPNLTAEDLKDLGVTRVGDRRRLLEAISALRNALDGYVSRIDVARLANGKAYVAFARADRSSVRRQMI
jgi:hypothetical protein